MATDMNESSTTEKMSKFQLSGTQTVLLFTGNWPVIYLNNPDNALLFLTCFLIVFIILTDISMNNPFAYVNNKNILSTI